MHVSEQSKSLPPIQPTPDCPKNCSSVASLHRHRDSMEFSDAGLSGGFAVAFIKKIADWDCYANIAKICFTQK